MRYFFVSFHADSKGGGTVFGNNVLQANEFPNHTGLRKKIYEGSGYSLENAAIISIQELSEEDYDAFVA